MALAAPLDQAAAPTSAPDTGGWAFTLAGIAAVAGAIAGLLWLGVADLPAALGLGFVLLYYLGIRVVAPRG